jgi:hypothetical protein
MVGGTRFTARFTKRALVEMKEEEREKILIGEEKNEPLAARKLEVSLDRADAFIEGAPGSAFLPGCRP